MATAIWPDFARRVPVASDHCLGNRADDSSDAARSVNWTPTGRCASSKRTASWTSVAIPGCFPAAAPTFVRTFLVLREMFPGNCSDIARKLSGDCPHDSADVARTRTGCGHGCGLTADWSWTGCGCGHRARHSPASARTLSVHCPDAGRIIPGYCLDNSPDDARMTRWTIHRTSCRMMRGHCATCCLTFM